MERIKIAPREDWQGKLEKLSFEYHSLQNVYWDESAHYKFTPLEIDKIEKATEALYQMCLTAVQHVIDNELFSKFFINEAIIPLILRSWDEEEPSIYGRFDLSYDGTNIKMLEFNADTPTSLYEAGVIQWYWLQDIDKDADQFNSIHEKLIEYWRSIRKYLRGTILHFGCIKNSIEDFTTVEYLRDAAVQAGLKTKFLYVEDIGWNMVDQCFVDLDGLPIINMFKLYPWEWMSNEEFGEKLSDDINEVKWIEPAWKTILSNKAILPILWELFPDNEYLLPAYFGEPKELKSYAKKPIYSREGANTTLVEDGNTLIATGGEYGEEGFIYQALAKAPNFDGNYPILGSWIIGQKAAGMGVRESSTLVTDNFSRFIPHLIK